MRPLETYRRKRDFSLTAEPPGAVEAAAGRSFVVQKHAARALHYDFRLEHDGVLLSWAVPKGPSIDPAVKRLAMQVEDHPVEYGGFEGSIAEGQYGAGTVIVWDRGTWRPDGDVQQMLAKGHLRFQLHGEKLRGGFVLLRAGKADKQGRQRWLLLKRDDAEAKRGSADALLVEEPASVLSGRSIEELANEPKKGKRAPAKVKQTIEKRKKRKPTPAVSLPSGAERGEMPAWVAPELALLTDQPPPGAEWFNEVKFDGYRMLARIEAGAVRLLSRRGNDWTERLPSLARAFLDLGVQNALIDGEVVVFDEQGVTDFQALQNSLDASKGEPCAYLAFDLLFFDGYDLRPLPLRDRKAALQRVFSNVENRRLRFSEHVIGHAPAFFENACKAGLEGIVCKRSDAPYTSRRSGAWLKCKCSERQEFVIGGYTEPAGSRSHFGALLLGLSTEEGLVYAGKVGTGFTEQSLRDLARRMKPLGRAECPFVKKPPGFSSGKLHWLEPKLVAEVRFAERTRSGLVRQASFQGLRQDKPAEEVHDEVRVSPARARGKKTPAPNLEGVSLTHPDRVLFPREGLTKLDLATHYAAVADWMLPHVSGRPLMVLRCPEGVNGECFYQKHPSRGLPNAVMAIGVAEKKGPKQHLTIDSLAGLLGLVQIGGLEIHTWGSRNESLDCPDRLTFDLDPAEELPWERVVEAALRVKEELARLGLQAFVKTTGGKGLHVVTPIEPTVKWDAAKAFSKRVVERIAKAEPSRYLTTMRKDKRRGRVFLDYLRNAKGATSVCAYSTRAKPGALVATPITWQELSAGARPEQFDVAAMIGRMKRLRRDPWFELDAHAVRLTDELLRRVGG